MTSINREVMFMKRVTGNKSKIEQYIPYILAVVIALCIKHHYSVANVHELKWILKPTAIIVELLNGMVFEKGETGYVNYQNHIVIAKSCAGVNFLIIAFCMVVFTQLKYCDRTKKWIALLCFGIITAYCLTLFVNTFRILVSIQLYTKEISFGWFTEDRIHRITGILIYFIFLYALYFTLPKNNRGTNKLNGIVKSSAFVSAAPLFWYLTITLFVPIINGSFFNNPARFIEHSSFVIIIPFIITSFFVITRSCFKHNKKFKQKSGFIVEMGLKPISTKKTAI